MSRTAFAALVTGAALAVAAAPAAADSIVYIKDHNVWLMAPDGSKQHQVTRDGSADEPYRSPSQDDQGRIAVIKGVAIQVLEQNGTRRARFVPPALTDTSGHSTSGQPAELALSPDGRRIAYMRTSLSCDLTIDCGARASVGIIDADGKGPATAPGTYGGNNPHWITSSRLIFDNGYLSQTRVFDLGSDEAWNWFDDSDIHGDVESTDLADASVSGDGRYFAAIRGYADTKTVAWYRVNGSIQSGPNPGLPTELCTTNADAQITDPSLAPDGSGIAIGDVDGIQVKRGLDDCAAPAFTLAAPGGSEPDWGPAEVAPKAKKKAKAPKRAKKRPR
jgi:Tol biopolymer transport system component